MTLADYVSRVTHIEHLMWVEWLNRQWNDPELTHWYLAQIAAEIRQTRYSFSKGGRGVRLKDLILKFVTREEKRGEGKEMTEEEAKRIETAWLARLNIIGPAARQGLVKREPGPQHTGKQRGAPLMNSAISTPKGKRGVPPKPEQKRKG